MQYKDDGGNVSVGIRPHDETWNTAGEGGVCTYQMCSLLGSSLQAWHNYIWRCMRPVFRKDSCLDVFVHPTATYPTLDNKEW